MAFLGIVDGFEAPNTFFGWSHGADPEKSQPVVEAYFDGKLVGSCRANRLSVAGNPPAVYFKMPCTIDFQPNDLLLGKLSFLARSDEGARKSALNLSEGLTMHFVKLAVAESLRVNTRADLIELLSAVSTKCDPVIKTSVQEVVALVRNGFSSLERSNSTNEEISYFGLLPGVLSPNKATVVGRGGNFFLTEGSNGLLEQYRTNANNPEVDVAAGKWIKILEDRMLKLSELDIEFRQIIIPEKASVIPNLFPAEIDPPTIYWKSLRKKIKEKPALASVVIDALDVLQQAEGKQTYLRHDSHMTPEGTAILMSEILKRLGHDTKFDFSFDEVRSIRGDHSAHFLGVPFREAVKFPKKEQFRDYEKELENTVSYSVPGKHVGSRCVWRNKGAPIRKKVIAFGNSFFEKGTVANGLSWWCCRWFEEFHFIWDSSIDYEYINEFGPDVVLCQTIERFLPRPPEY